MISSRENVSKCDSPVFLSGATGALGSEVLRVLLETGFKVKILVRKISRLSPFFHDKWKGFAGTIEEIVEGDLSRRDGHTTGRIFAGMRDCSIVYHCAGVPEGWQADEEVWDAVNRNGTEVMLDAAAAAGVRMFVHVSAIETFSAQCGLVTLTEAGAQVDSSDPRATPYQQSKIRAEAAVKLARSKHNGMQCVMLNAASFYGPTSRGCWVNDFILSILCGKSVQVPTGGLCVIYIPELARVVVEAGWMGLDGEQYIIADAYLSTSEIALALNAVGNPKLKHETTISTINLY